MVSDERRKELLQGDLLLRVLDHVLDELMAGKRPDDRTVADHFGITLEEAELIHDHLEETGEV